MTRRSLRRGPGIRLRQIVCAVMLAVVAFTAAPASAASVGDVADATFDVLVLRPLNLTAVITGAAFFLISAPFVAPVEGLGTSWEVFVYAPYEYTIARPIGDI